MRKMARSISPLACSQLTILVLVSLWTYHVTALRMRHKDLTLGFVSVPLNRSNLIIQKPYNLDVAQRYQYKHGIHKLWAFSTDKPHSRASKTHARCEIRVKGYDYSSGVWQFEAYGYVNSNTSGASVMQVFGATRPYASTLMLRAGKNTLTYYTNPVLIPNVYNKWFKLNVIHDADHDTVQVFINNELKHEARGRKARSHFFKCGVYAGRTSSYYMESRWKKIKVLQKCG